MKKICSIVVLLFCIWMPITVLANEAEKEYTEGRFIYHSRDGYVSICGYIGNTEEIIIPSSLSGKPVSQIEDYAFSGCTNTTTVYLPDTILFIGEHPFDGMDNLKKVECEAVDVVTPIPDGVTLVEKNNSSSETTSEKSQNETQENSTEKVTEQETENSTQDSTKSSISGTDNQSGEKLENQTEKATDGSETLYDPSNNTDNKNQVTQETQKSEQNVTNKNDVSNESTVDKNNVDEVAADRIEPDDETNIMNSTEKVTEQETENSTQDSTKSSISGTDNQSGEKLDNQTEKATDGSETLYDPSKNTDNKNQVTQETQKSEQNITNKNDVSNESTVDKNNVGEVAADRIEPDDETNIIESDNASLLDIPVDDKKVAENHNNLPYALIIIVVIIVIAGTAGFIVYKKKK